MVDISFCIPMIHEYPSIYFTLFSIQNEMTDANYTYEINVVETAEVDPYTENFKKLFGLPMRRQLINYDFQEVNCGPASRMHAARMAKGKYIIFADAHTVFGKNTIPMMINTLEEDICDEVHGTTLKSHYEKNAGAHYKLFNNAGPRLNTHFHGSYSRVISDKPYDCVNANLAYVSFRTKEFLDSRGYHPACRFYPHPEGYLPLKYLMLGKRVMVNPDCFHFHSNHPRNYGTQIKDGYIIKINNEDYKLVGQDFLIRNAMLCAYTLGGDKWIDILKESWLERGTKKYVIDGIYEEVKQTATEERKWVEQNAKYTLDEVLINARKNKVAGMEDWLDAIGSDPLC